MRRCIHGVKDVPLVLLAILFLTTTNLALAQAPETPLETLRQAIGKAGDTEKNGGADLVVVFDRRDVKVEATGLSRTTQHTLQNVKVVRCRVVSADGTVRTIEPASVIDAPDPQYSIYWNARHKLVPIGRLEVGDAVELVTLRVGFTYALLAGNDDPDESRFIPPMRGQFYDIVPFWSEYPVLEQSYRVAAPLEKHLQYQFYNGAAEVADRVEEGVRVVKVTTRNFKPVEREAGMVALSDVAPKLLLTTAVDWKAKAVWFHSTQETAKCFEVTPKIKALADEITKGLTRPEDKAAALNHWAAENIRYVGLHMGKGEGYTLHPAEMTLRDRGGVCKDKAGMLVALLRAAGLESFPAMTMAGERIERIAADQFNHCVTVWRKPDGTVQLLDPTWVPGVREMWSAREQQQEVLMGLPEGADLITTALSPPDNHPLTVAIRSKLATDGTLSGTMTVDADGQSDAGIRRFYRGRPRTDWPALDRNWLSAVDQRAQITAIARTEPDDLSKPWSMTLTFTIPGYARVLDDGALLLTPLAARHPIGQLQRAEEISMSTRVVERRFPTRVGCTKLVTLSERMTLPAGVTVDGLPDSVTLDGNARFNASWKVVAGELIIDESLAFTTRIIEPEQWPSARKAVESFRTLAETPVLVKAASRKEKK
jgi:hypothetical protein